jgi:tRNA (cmo5U34)-methyltransferase
MESIDEKRFFTMAETYDNMAQLLVPKYDFLQDEAINILSYGTEENLTIIDLGAGSGILLEKLLIKYPKAKCYYIDFSDDFIKIAQKRLSKFSQRVTFLNVPLEAEWESKLGGKPDVVFSMSAIHHLETMGKKKLYQRCFNVLNRSGWFINIDEMNTRFPDAYLNSLYFWKNYVDNKKEEVPAEKKNFYMKWRNHFDNWKVRNIDNLGGTKSKGDDIHDFFMDQVEWLKKIGFKNVDLFVKYHLWSVIGGQKP